MRLWKTHKKETKQSQLSTWEQRIAVEFKWAITDSRVLYSVLTNMPITKNKEFTKDWLRWDSDTVSGRIWVKHHTCMSGQHSLCSDRAYSSPAHLADTIANKNAVGHFSSTVSRSLNGSCWKAISIIFTSHGGRASCFWQGGTLLPPWRTEQRGDNKWI